MEKIKNTIYDFFDRNLYKRRDILATEREVLKSPNLIMTQGINVDPSLGVSTLVPDYQTQITQIQEEIQNQPTTDGAITIISPNALVSTGYTDTYTSFSGSNICIGRGALSLATGVQQADIVIGYIAGRSSIGLNTNNIFIGQYSGYSSSLTNSTCIGNQAGQNTTGTNDYNLFIGHGSGDGSSNVGLSTIIGALQAGYRVSGGSMTLIGSTSGYNAGNCENSVLIGNYAGYQHSSRFSVAIGLQAGSSNIIKSSLYYVAIGLFAGNATTTNITGAVFIGYDAGGSSANQQNAVYVGREAGKSSTRGSSTSSNVGIGAYSLNTALTSYDNVAIGPYSGYKIKTGIENIIIGNYTASDNTGAATSAENLTRCVLIGSWRGASAKNIQNVVWIGSNTSNTVETLTVGGNEFSVIIGPNLYTGGFKNSVLIGGAAFGTPQYNTTSNEFKITSNITKLNLRAVPYEMPVTQGAAGSVLTNDGTGILYWA